LFLGDSARGRFPDTLTLSSPSKPAPTSSALPRSIAAPAEPAAPKASRQNCRRAEACRAFFLMRSSAKVFIAWSLSSSSTSSPLTSAPTGLIRSWHTLEHSRAARSSISREPCMAGLRLPGEGERGALERDSGDARGGGCDTTLMRKLPRQPSTPHILLHCDEALRLDEAAVAPAALERSP